MQLVTPDIGLLFWMLVSFTIVLILLRKYAWKPILNGLKSREESIENALNEAHRAKAEMAELQASNEALLKEARIERDKILKEARDMRDKMVGDAKNTAKTEADKMIASAREAIQNEKAAAVTELKNQVAILSIQIAEKVMKSELTDGEKQKNLVNSMLDEVKLN
ncbi:MAG: F0F1 ATP synthase subunit B [Flavobacteriales bacterium]|nr:F0F1 ATP synthase subunit B [Flavobacteriales bacterium]